jgi:hypothetical protein
MEDILLNTFTYLSTIHNSMQNNHKRSMGISHHPKIILVGAPDRCGLSKQKQTPPPPCADDST